MITEPRATTEAPAVARLVRVVGTVQGVGFRPFVYRLARRSGLRGWVRNTAGAVEVLVEGASPAISAFLRDLQTEAPPLSRIDRVVVEEREPRGAAEFRILESKLEPGWQPVSPDVATCDDCLHEIFDPSDRRYLYPFTNCTNCGPRFTIIEGMPYDRSRTTMSRFRMCADCRREYDDPSNRRFHAEPVACPACGPRLWLHVPGAPPSTGEPLAEAVDLLRAGRILAVKGLGGFHLACDASNGKSVRRLRERKHRYGKPLAIMVPDLESARRLAALHPLEVEALTSRERPIVLTDRLEGAAIARSVAPHLATLGIMLPYTPLHHLLLAGFDAPLIMTSGNLSEEPIATENDEAVERLSGIADAFLLHDRGIRTRYDDSVVRLVGNAVTPFRRSRGYAPAPLHLRRASGRDVLAFGAHQKAAFCVLKGDQAFLGQHIGDLDNMETVDHLRSSIDLFLQLFRASPAVVAHDLHPDYASTRMAEEWARREGAQRIPVQHHHAHVVACMAEHQLTSPVIGVAYDGTGLGLDGTVWGGEVLVADTVLFRRTAHLRSAPLLGGESAIRHPYRMAASYLWEFFGDASEFDTFFSRLPPGELEILRSGWHARVNAPASSSCGRLFDAFSALVGVCTHAAYEGEPAVRLEAAASRTAGEAYPFSTRFSGDAWVADPAPMLAAAWHELHRGIAVSDIARHFHATIAAMTVSLCAATRDDVGINDVCLSGGCFQNALLTGLTVAGLESAGFRVFTHRLVPPNDGGLALGQAVVATALASSVTLSGHPAAVT